jgi:quercetin dioxygenase-like cupin family protein
MEAIKMSAKRVLVGVLVALFAGTGVVAAAHVVQVDPSTVPVGFLVAHNHIRNFNENALHRWVDQDEGDITVQHFQVGPNAALPWHSHPGPVIVTVVAGQLTYQDAPQGVCRNRTYEAGEGFTDRGFGYVHRAIAGPDGAHFYAVYLMPSGSTTHVTEADPLEACL